VTERATALSTEATLVAYPAVCPNPRCTAPSQGKVTERVDGTGEKRHVRFVRELSLLIIQAARCRMAV
jgi:hypothetical protein